MDWTPEEFAKAMEAINQKAATDKAFRKLVLDNPREAIQSLLGKELPAGQTIQFIENLPGMDQTFILPPYQGELSREELKKVTGGGEHTDCGMGAYADCGMGLYIAK